MLSITNKSTLFDVVHEHPETKDFFIAQGLNQVENQKQLETMGKMLTLEMIASSKKINLKLLIEGIEGIIEDKQQITDTTLVERERKAQADIQIQGILPCPVRIPLLEKFEGWLEDQAPEYKESLDYELKAASMGVDWLKDKLVEGASPDELADVFLSAGFDLFFDPALMGHYKAAKVFKDLMKVDAYNSDFENETISLKDPDGDYSMIGVVPAVFLVNTDALEGRPVPYSWDELLNDIYADSVSLPVGDFDLFNAILLNIYRMKGMDGVKKLAKVFKRSMHPSQMVKSDKKPEQPAVTIMPYFFTKMVRGNGPMQAIWPSDGAIISPIFMLTKAEKEEQLQPIVDFFASKEVGEVLSHNGRFPSVHPEVDNLITPDKTYMWVGWEFIRQNDIGTLLQKCLTTFNGGI